MRPTRVRPTRVLAKVSHAQGPYPNPNHNHNHNPNPNLACRPRCMVPMEELGDGEGYAGELDYPTEKETVVA